ncbi:MAG: aspartate aminotransferase family protein [Bdellovibrionales bacterium]
METLRENVFASTHPELLKHFGHLAERLCQHFETLRSMPVNPRPKLEEVQKSLSFFTLGEDRFSLEDLIRRFTGDLSRYLLHVDHPMYFGVFNPNPLFPGVLAEALVAQVNAQLASSASALYAIEIEKKLIAYLGEKIGYSPDHLDGTFCTGGTEANLTAVLCALWRRCPEFFTSGARHLRQPLAVYSSVETHHSIKKALRLLGLGNESLRIIDTDTHLRFSCARLQEQIREDQQQGYRPILVVATLGSTSVGVIDPIEDLARLARASEADLHVDAAWGGGAVLLPELATALTGLGNADSVTIDAHKWFAAPMTAGIFISRHSGILRSVFNIGESPYMPPSSYRDALTEPFAESLQWSRRFMGLKLLFPLLTLGEAGYQELFRHSMSLATHFRHLLRAGESWDILNETPLPVVCFRPKGIMDKDAIEAFAEEINASGEAWITTTHIGNRREAVLRVGFPNFATEETHVQQLFALLQSRRSRL